MKIFTISLPQEVADEFYLANINDYSLSHAIVANNEREATQLAKKAAFDEGEDIWDKIEVKTIGNYTGSHKEPHILVSSYNAS